MGNLSTSCFKYNEQKARVVDVDGNVRSVKVPITAAEMMLLEQPGSLISPPLELRNLGSRFRLSALPADQVLTKGKLYMLIPAGRLNSFITQSELEMLNSVINKKKEKKQPKRRRTSKVLPQEQEETIGDALGITGVQRMGNTSPMWQPVLEPIYE
ncbi:hypothetical protein OSB04_022867 [Centaurea solstitialis]|uniref:Uncharacterized protein n=1 Tax=Centaurea solstitialis TaxID=347529 RepID=A0AA38SVH6_9ASTR|nr:hypothetical protein OSB04_022867 [Centaurea solstitialis]